MTGPARILASRWRSRLDSIRLELGARRTTSQRLLDEGKLKLNPQKTSVQREDFAS